MLVGVNLLCALVGYSFLAYALARLRWRGRGIVLVLFAIILCAQVWFVPQLISTFALGLPEVRYWIWFADWLTCAFSTVLLWHVLKDVPPDRADAAKIDGCSPLGIYWHVVLPLVRPTMLILGLLTLMANTAELLAREIENLQGQSTFIVTSIFAMILGSTIMALPLVAIFFIAKKILPAKKSSDGV
jgi:multiple sugar transport system permease protein